MRRPGSPAHPAAAGAGDRLAVDIIEELFVVAPPERVRAVLCADTAWRIWFPEVRLSAYEDRGCLGVRWVVSGELVGTAEVWLQQHGDGTIVHVYVRADPARRGRLRPAATRRRVRRRFALPLKRHLVGVKDRIEGGRAAGAALVPLTERVSSAPHDG